MSASALCPHCYLEAVRLRLHELFLEDVDDIHPMGRSRYFEHLQDAREAWYVGNLAGIAEATRRAEELIAQERRWARESLETARGLRR
jgi:hypothetical protein